MARRIKSNLDNRTARARLRHGPKTKNSPLYVSIERGVQLGWRPSMSSSRAGVWMLRQFDGQRDGKRRYRHTVIGIADDVNDADGVNVLSYWQAVEAVRERLKQKATDASKPLTVAGIMREYLDFVESKRKDGANTKSRIERFILPAFGDRDAASLTRKEIQDWLNTIAASPALIRTSKKATEPRRRKLDTADAHRARKATANRILTTFKAGLNYKYDLDELVCVPVWRKVEPFPEVGKARVRFLSLGECTRLINASTGDFRNLVRAALFTGCRYGELARLMVADFHPDGHATIFIRDSKADKSRHVFLNDEAVKFFTAICAGRARNEPMLLRGDRHWKSNEQAKPMKQACEGAKIRPINFHALRHSYASLALMADPPMQMLVLARNLGHRDTKMVEAHYGHLAKDYEAKVVRESAPSFGIAPDTNVVAIRG